MFSNHNLLKVSGVCFVASGFLLASLTIAQEQSSRAKSAASFYARGNEWHARGEFDRAIDDYSIAIIFNPSFAQAYYFRARARLSKGEREAALGDFNRALELDPRYAEVYANRGV
jgi:tetratricopeptide (TPR) repeat protein